MNNIWEDLQSYFNADRNDYMAGSVDEKEISKAEKKLNLSFSNAYKKFLNLYGGAMINGDLVYGLKYQEDMDNNNWSVIDKTNFYRNQNWPDIIDWYIVSDDGRGNPIGCKPDGSVWLSDHDANFEQTKLADNFEEFLYKLLTETLYE